MANTFLTPQQITRESLRILHQKLNFVGTINRQYDESFAKSGAKIGDTLKIRLPNQYIVRTGATLTTQDTAEQSVSLQIGTQKGVDLNFTSVDLTLSLDDFSTRIIEPAMAVLAANVEADAMSMALTTHNAVYNMGAANSFSQVLKARKILMDSLAPLSNRTANLNTQDNVDMISDVKGLFNDRQTLSQQYKEGEVGRTAGFDFYENTMWPSFTRGAANGAYVTDTTAIASGATTLAVTAGAGALNVGDVFQIAGVYRVHPETKLSTGILHNFVVTAAYAGGAGNISFSPAINLAAANGLQNCVIVGAAAGKAVTVSGTANGVTGTSLMYHKDAFAFATADLVMPKGVDFAAREVMDGISMRVVRAYDINNDKFPCRLDILYGYKTLRAGQAVRLHNN